MTDSTPIADPGPEAGGESATPSHPGAPRWVKAFAGLALLVVVVVAVAMLAGGNHSPGRHLGGDSSTQTQPGAAHTPPPGGHP